MRFCVPQAENGLVTPAPAGAGNTKKNKSTIIRTKEMSINRLSQNGTAELHKKSSHQHGIAG